MTYDELARAEKALAEGKLQNIRADRIKIGDTLYLPTGISTVTQCSMVRTAPSTYVEHVWSEQGHLRLPAEKQVLVERCS